MTESGQSGTGIKNIADARTSPVPVRGRSPVPECFGTGLRCHIPKCQCGDISVCAACADAHLCQQHELGNARLIRYQWYRSDPDAGLTQLTNG